MRKRFLLTVVGLYLLYLAGGLVLAYSGVVDRVYFLPYYAIKRPHTDKSAFAPDGPVVQYQPDGSALSRRIVPGARARWCRLIRCAAPPIR